MLCIVPGAMPCIAQQGRHAGLNVLCRACTACRFLQEYDSQRCQAREEIEIRLGGTARTISRCWCAGRHKRYAVTCSSFRGRMIFAIAPFVPSLVPLSRLGHDCPCYSACAAPSMQACHPQFLGSNSNSAHFFQLGVVIKHNGAIIVIHNPCRETGQWISFSSGRIIESKKSP